MAPVAVLGTVAAALPAAVAALAVEVGRARRGAVLPADPGYVVDATVGNGSGPPLEVVVLGDSTVAGVGAPTLDGCLPVHLARRLAAGSGRTVHVRGLGVGSARTEDVLRVQVPRLAGRADLAVVVVGPNDVLYRTPPPRVTAATAALLRAVAACVEAPVVLCGNPRFGPVTAVGGTARALADAYGRSVGRAQRAGVARAEQGCVFVDVAAAVGTRFRGVEGLMAEDGFHPSPLGYQLWAEAIAPEVLAAVV